MTQLTQQVKALLKDNEKSSPLGSAENFTLDRLHGDASNRIYYRINCAKGSLILMERPNQKGDSPSEEISKEPSGFSDYSFLNIGQFLLRSNIRVPKVIGFNSSQNLILLEDVGNTTFEMKIKNHPSSLRVLYQKALDLLAKIQDLKKDSTCIAWKRNFDGDLLEWEFEHFIEWGLEKSLKVNLNKKERKEMRLIFKDITSEITQMEACFCHRDFQSKNLMSFKDDLVLLDFQDALCGPKPYDLVALLRDSYIELSEEDLTFLQNCYIEKTGSADQDLFLRNFDLQTIQRKLKDGGRFHYIHLFKDNPNFLEYIPSSYRYVLRALKRQPEGKHLIPILQKYIQEFSL